MATDSDLILDRMRRLCSMREYCEADIRGKISAALRKSAEKNGGELSCGILPASGDDMTARTEALLAVLREEKYVSDERYAAAFARDKSSLSGWGCMKIRYALAAKGLDKPVIDNALCEIDEAAASLKLEKVIAAKYRVLKDDPQWRLKLTRFALGRGYEYDRVRSVIQRLINESMNQ